MSLPEILDLSGDLYSNQIEASWHIALNQLENSTPVRMLSRNIEVFQLDPMTKEPTPIGMTECLNLIDTTETWLTEVGGETWITSPIVTLGNQAKGVVLARQFNTQQGNGATYSTIKNALANLRYPLSSA